MLHLLIHLVGDLYSEVELFLAVQLISRVCKLQIHQVPFLPEGLSLPDSLEFCKVVIGFAERYY